VKQTTKYKISHANFILPTMTITCGDVTDGWGS